MTSLHSTLAGAIRAVVDACACGAVDGVRGAREAIAELRAIGASLQRPQFTVTIMGNIKVGKSTTMNCCVCGGRRVMYCPRRRCLSPLDTTGPATMW